MCKQLRDFARDAIIYDFIWIPPGDHPIKSKTRAWKIKQSVEPQILAQSGQESLATNAEKNTGLAKQNDSPAGPQANTTK